MELTDKVIKDLVKRRHPEYEKKKEHWDFISATYAGGRAWFDDNVFRYFKEGERTKQDNAKGIDNSSGAAKAYDFQRVNSLLVTKAERLERAERQMLALVGKWMGEELEEDHTLVSYPESFDIRGLTDEFAVAQQLSELQAPESVRRYQMEMLIDKIFPNVTEKMKKEFEADLLKFPPKNVSAGIENRLSTTYDKASSQETENTSSQGSGNSSAQATER